ncbi:YrbL family protein [Vibrio sp. HA2012]|uniref:YrbL family protein n=1 Tax=Vibrio sp. HA2012 TaxID=1971595 RepID=UPI0012FD2797|nr:YrbL family protein [Vibrio sp. HA2012]
MIMLSKADMLGKGTTRTCYQHPDNADLCIKVMHSHSPLKINKLEYRFYNKLYKKDVPLEHLPKCFGFVETNLGTGLVYEHINSECGGNLYDIIRDNQLPKEKVTGLLKELEHYCLSNFICMCDEGLRNIIFSKNRLYYIDGVITNKKRKSFLYTGLGFFGRRKTRKTVRNMLSEVEAAYA